METINYAPEEVEAWLKSVTTPKNREKAQNEAFIYAFNAMATKNHAAMDANGFWDMRRAIPDNASTTWNTEDAPEVAKAAQNAVDIQDLALMHEEISEAVSAVRHGNPASDHIPTFSHVEEELCDCVLRIMDYSAGRGLRVAEALIEKMRFNATRPFRHSKQC